MKGQSDLAGHIVDLEGTYDSSSPDNEELRQILAFNNCTCKRNRGRHDPCTNKFEPLYILKLRAQMGDAELTSREREM